jgi:N-dimethylarginine dimethylaminohydrolase
MMAQARRNQRLACPVQANDFESLPEQAFMLLDQDLAAARQGGSRTLPAQPRTRWGVDSEYGVLRDVMICEPDHLEVIPCNTVARDSLAQGLACCPDEAARQHRLFASTLAGEGVRCHLVPPSPGFADLAFTRDSTLMTPWGLLELNLAERHRTGEGAHVAAAAARWGVSLLGSLGEGRIEGGDVCLVRPGIAAIGWSGGRTDDAGALALARFFQAHGWRTILTRFHRHFLHLDTLFTMLDRDRAVGCIEALEPDFLAEIAALGISIVPVSEAEVARLGANIFSLGAGRLLTSRENGRLNDELTRLGYLVTALDIGQFTRCGGGMHCLTMPLARLPG